MLHIRYLSFFWTLGIWSPTGNNAIPRLNENSRDPHPCASVLCYFNAMCVVDPDTNLGYCDCPTSECDTSPDFPFCAEGITFRSPCHAHMYMCKMQREIKLKRGGVCNTSACGPTNPCAFHGICVDGSCTCNSCNNARYDIDSLTETTQPVCGSNGIRYASKCSLEYASCTSKTVIRVADESQCTLGFLQQEVAVDSPVAKSIIEIDKLQAPEPVVTEHLRPWISGIESEDNKFIDRDDEITSRRTRGTGGGICEAFELRGCLPGSHLRRKHLGTYTINPVVRRFGSPVYRKVTSLRNGRKSVYLSRFKSARVGNRGWVIGSYVGNGYGWLGVADSAVDPRNISAIWYSTTGTRSSPWRKEPTLRLHCLDDKLKRVHPLLECVSDEVTGSRGVNSFNNTEGGVPLYQLTVTNRSGDFLDKYHPGEHVKATVSHSDRLHRFKTMYLVVRNELDECGVPRLRKAKKRFTSSCYGQMLSRHARRMGKVKMHFRMPIRGCVTFNVLLESIKGEVYYDLRASEHVHQKHLTRTVCPHDDALD